MNSRAGTIIWQANPWDTQDIYTIQLSTSTHTGGRLFSVGVLVSLVYVGTLGHVADSFRCLWRIIIVLRISPRIHSIGCHICKSFRSWVGNPIRRTHNLALFSSSSFISLLTLCGFHSKVFWINIILTTSNQSALCTLKRTRQQPTTPICSTKAMAIKLWWEEE